MKDIFYKVDYVVQMYCDNESAIILAPNQIFHNKVYHHFVREKVLNQKFKLKIVSISNQIVDIFKKVLAKVKF